LHHLFITMSLPHPETNTSRFSQVTMSTMSYWPCLACMLVMFYG
jgi:hypothetical protein